MNALKKVALFAGLALFVLGVKVPASFAGYHDTNQAVQLTFDQDVRIPGHVLTAGTYWFKILDLNGGNDVVRIYNANGTKMICEESVLVTDPTGGNGGPATDYGVRWPTGKAVVRFAMSADGQPPALLSWFYPGVPAGHQFNYGPRMRRQLNELDHVTVAVTAHRGVTVGRDLA